MFHLLDEDDAPRSLCLVNSTLAPYNWQMFQGPKKVSRYKGKTYIIILSLIDSLQAFSIHLETHEDILVSPHPLGSTTGSCLENKGPTHCPLCLESISTSWHPLDFIRPPQRSNYSFYWRFKPLERLILMLLSHLVCLSPKVLLLCTSFYFRG